MLDKREWTRLGSKSGASEVKQHKWFAKINWGLLRNTQPPVSFPPVSHPIRHIRHVLSRAPRTCASPLACVMATPDDASAYVPHFGTHAARCWIGSRATDSLVCGEVALRARRDLPSGTNYLPDWEDPWIPCIPIPIDQISSPSRVLLRGRVMWKSAVSAMSWSHRTGVRSYLPISSYAALWLRSRPTSHGHILSPRSLLHIAVQFADHRVSPWPHDLPRAPRSSVMHRSYPPPQTGSMP